VAIIIHISANIGNSSKDVACDGRARFLIRAISIKTAWDSIGFSRDFPWCERHDLSRWYLASFNQSPNDLMAHG
jgi:hypothetical protein